MAQGKTAISHLKDEVASNYIINTLQYKKVAQILCERHPDLPSLELCARVGSDGIVRRVMQRRHPYGKRSTS